MGARSQHDRCEPAYFEMYGHAREVMESLLLQGKTQYGTRYKRHTPTLAASREMI